MGRYTLILESDLEGKKIIEVGGVKKTSLKKIDLVTTQTKSKEDLLDMLECDIDGGFDFYITYRQDKKEKRLPIAYDNKRKLANVRMDNESFVNIEDVYFKQILKTFLEAIKRPRYMKILESDRVLTAKLDEYVDIWMHEDQSEFTRGKVSYYMSSYKQLREIIFSFEKYNEMNKQKRR